MTDLVVECGGAEGSQVRVWREQEGRIVSGSARREVDEVGELFDEMNDLVDIIHGNIHLGYWTGDDDPAPLADAAVLCDLVADAGLVVDQRRDLGARARRTYDEMIALFRTRPAALTDVYGAERMRTFADRLVPVFEVCRAKLGYLLVAGHKPAPGR